VYQRIPLTFNRQSDYKKLETKTKAKEEKEAGRGEDAVRDRSGDHSRVGGDGSLRVHLRDCATLFGASSRQANLRYLSPIFLDRCS